jgi:hypothetical protein
VPRGVGCCHHYWSGYCTESTGGMCGYSCLVPLAVVWVWCALYPRGGGSGVISHVHASMSKYIHAHSCSEIHTSTHSIVHENLLVSIYASIYTYMHTGIHTNCILLCSLITRFVACGNRLCIALVPFITRAFTVCCAPMSTLVATHTAPIHFGFFHTVTVQHVFVGYPTIYAGTF